MTSQMTLGARKLVLHQLGLPMNPGSGEHPMSPKLHLAMLSWAPDPPAP